jgi:signal transduction histidine kinase
MTVEHVRPEDVVRLLLVEDDEQDFLLTRGLLNDIRQYSFEITWIKDYERGLSELAGGQYDVALVDFRLGARDGVSLIGEARARGTRQPIILLTDQNDRQNDREIDLAAAEAGASDFLCKTEVTAPMLERAVRYNMQTAKLQEQRVRLLAERAARAEAEAGSRAKDQFLATLSHELRTPLTPALIAIASLCADESMPPAFRDDLNMIRRNIELEARLIDDLLDLTRIARGNLDLHLAPIDLHVKLESVLHISRPEIAAKKINIAISKDATAHFIAGDPARIQQILWNLLKNAVKFTPEGGHIQIATANDGDQVVVTITDSGVGIDPRMLPRIFEAFERGGGMPTVGATAGLGLGLTISKSLAELHHGKLTAVSEGPGKGSTFVLRLPAIQHLPPPRAAVPPQSLGVARHILFVEDHADTAAAMVRVLGRQGYRITRAEDVASAKRAVDADNFDLVISDIGLPDGSGLDIVRHLRQKRDTPAIAVSGYGMAQDVASAEAAGFNRHLTKPVHPDILLDAVAEFLKRP